MSGRIYRLQTVRGSILLHDALSQYSPLNPGSDSLLVLAGIAGIKI